MEYQTNKIHKKGQTRKLRKLAEQVSCERQDFENELKLAMINMIVDLAKTYITHRKSFVNNTFSSTISLVDLVDEHLL